MKQFIGKQMAFIPEVLKDGFLVGHTGNYLLVKKKGNLLHHLEESGIVTKIEYPYMVME